jgi:hypothetical protein
MMYLSPDKSLPTKLLRNLDSALAAAVTENTNLVDACTMFLDCTQAFHGNVHAAITSSEDIGKATDLLGITDVANTHITDEEGRWKNGVPHAEFEEGIYHAAAGLMVSMSQV